MRVSFKHDRVRGRVPEQNILPADGEVFYVPRDQATEYTTLAALPPGTSPGSRPGMPKKSFHTRAIGSVSLIKYQPSRVTIGDEKYVRIARPTPGQTTEYRRVYIVRPCRYTDQEGASDESSTARCHGRTQAEHDEQRNREQLHRTACQLSPERVAHYGIKDCKSKPKRRKTR